ncbi:MAG: terpene cyclase/mutase family protein [Actinobacteria bacterium]|nr:terpene cyclase/mutase family protein [Actinomycetota bacterium]
MKYNKSIGSAREWFYRMERKGKGGMKGDTGQAEKETPKVEAGFSKRKALTLAMTAALFLTLFTVPFPARAGTGEALAYIRACQAPDGGFSEPGRGGNGQDATTAWCIMALSAAGADPSSVRSQGRSPLDFLATQSANWRSVTDYERTLLAVVAGGGNPYDFAGLDLVAKVKSFQRPGGNIGDAVNSNAFGILAYKAAGVGIPPGAVQWQKTAQNRDGGWGNSPGAASNPDMTAASIMALRAAGVDPSDPSIVSALSYLRSIQNGDGGFAFQSASSDVSATAWCVQALVAAGQDPAGAAWSKNGNTPWSFILSMQAPDGHFVWMQGRDVNPLWTTAYAVCALARRPYPVAVFRSEESSFAEGVTAAPPAGEEPSGAGTPGEETATEAVGAAQGGDSGAAPEEPPVEEAAGNEGRAETVMPREEGEEKGGGVHPAAWAVPLAVTALLGAVAYWYFMVKRRPASGSKG